jgi:hypothetical protein
MWNISVLANLILVSGVFLLCLSISLVCMTLVYVEIFKK